jgi:hypothetical protein
MWPTIRLVTRPVDRALPYSAAVLDSRFALPFDANERLLLTTFLDFQRDALSRKCSGLTDEQLRSRPVPSSNVSLIGLVRHLAGVERWYFQAVIADHFPGPIFDFESDAAFNDVADASGAENLAIWQGEVDTSRRITAERSLGAVGCTSDGTRVSLRWVLVHMIDEYARHLGHADIVREAIDGASGE